MWFITFLAKNLLKRKIRSALTCVGIGIAVGTMVVLVGISDGFERSMTEAFERRNNDIIVVEQNVLNQLDSDIDQRVIEQVRRIPEVKAVAPALLELVGFQIRGSTVPVTFQGWEPGSYPFDDLEMTSGRKIRSDDGRVAMLTTTMAEHLHKGIGDTIDIEGDPYEIVGVFKSFTNVENTTVIVPLAQLQKTMVRPGRITGFSAVLRDSDKDKESVDEVCRAINALKLPNGRSARLSAKPTVEYVREATHIRAVKAMAWLTSLIAVGVGAVVILNTMAMSVVERIHEIGVLRAIGWRKSRVVRMIVGESLILSLAGAVLGALVAVGIIRWLSTWPAAADVVPRNVSLAVLGKGLLMAVLLGLLGAIYPAIHAARLLPSEGLRHE